MKRLLMIQVDPDAHRMLAALTGGDGMASVERVIERLAAHAADGVRRPGAWERDWVRQVFGDEFEGRLELDPRCPTHHRPKRQADAGARQEPPP